MGCCCTPYCHRYVLWRCNLFFCGILSRPSLILKTSGPPNNVFPNCSHDQSDTLVYKEAVFDSVAGQEVSICRRLFPLLVFSTMTLSMQQKYRRHSRHFE